MNDTGNVSLILDHEKLYEEAGKLTNAKTVELDGVTTISGEHPNHGRVHIVIPAIGFGMMMNAFIFGTLVNIADIIQLFPHDFLFAS